MARGRVLVSVSYEGEEGGAELLADTPRGEEGSTELRQRRPVDVGQVSFSSLTGKDHCQHLNT